jgi:tetratricopeptide (TPR) repeat protein
MLEAEQYLKEATDRIDYNDRVAYNYGLVLQKIGKRPEAEQAFRKGLKINPNSESNLYALLYMYMEQNRYKDAKALIGKLIALDPQNQQYQSINATIQRALSAK